MCGACGAAVSPQEIKRGGICPKCFTPDLRLEPKPDPAPRRGSTAMFTPMDDVEELELIPCDAPLVAPLGGVENCAVIVVSGEPGEGKSTECARVAVALNKPPAYWDREMGMKRCNVVLQDAGASPRFIARTGRIVGESWRDAFELALSRDVWIIDSATAWCPQAEEDEFARALVEAAEEGRIIMVVQQWSQQGRARGTLTLAHLGDVRIEVRRDEFVVKKARWGVADTYPRPRIITDRMKRAAGA